VIYINDIGLFIRKVREKKNISIRKLAKYSGVSPAYISQLENNYRKNPTTHVLRSLCDGLDVEYEDFLLQFNQLTKQGVKECHHFYKQYKNDNQNTEKRNDIYDAEYEDLYDLLTKNDNVYYKNKLLSQTDKEKVLTILQTLLE